MEAKLKNIEKKKTEKNKQFNTETYYFKTS